MTEFLVGWSSAISVSTAVLAHGVVPEGLDTHIAAARAALASGGRLPSQIAIDKTSLAVLLIARVQTESGTSGLDEAVSLLEDVLERHVLDALARASVEVVLANALLERNVRTGNAADIARALHHIDSPAPTVLPEPLPTTRESLRGAALLRRWERYSNGSDLLESIATYRSCIGRAVEPVLRASISNNLSAALALSFAVTGDESELREALDLASDSIAALDGTGTSAQGLRRRARATRAIVLATRWRFFRDPDDLAQAQATIEELIAEPTGSVGLTKVEALLVAGSLHADVAVAYEDVRECDLAVSAYARAITLADPATPMHDLVSAGYANSRAVRFELTGDADDIEAALALTQRIAGQAPPSAIHDHNLAVLLSGRYDKLGDPNDLEAALMHHERALATAEPTGADFDLILVRAALSYARRYLEQAAEDDRTRLFELLDRAARLPGITLHRILSTRLLTEFAAEAGRWVTCAEAAELSLSAVETAVAAMDVSRWADWLDRNQGVAALGAYAAARSGNLARAVAIVERGCGVLAAGRIAQQRTSLTAAVEAGFAAEVAAYEAAVERVRHALVDGPPNERGDLPRPSAPIGPLLLAGELVAVAGRPGGPGLAAAIDNLTAARQALLEAVPNLRPAATPAELLAFVEETGEDLVYLISTSVGGAALTVHPAEAASVGPRLAPGMRVSWLPALDAYRVDALVERLHAAPMSAPVERGRSPGVRGASQRPGGEAVAAVVADLADVLDDGSYRRPGHLVTVGRLAMLPVCAAWRSVDGRAVPVGTAGSGLLHVTARHNARERAAGGTRIAAITNPRPCHWDGYPMPDLLSATDEGEFLAVEFGAEHLDGNAATFDALAEVLRDESLSVLHVAAHGWTSEQDPDRVRLLLVDGPDGIARSVSVSDLPHRLPCSTVFLACCWGARTAARLPDESVGFATSLVQAGAACVIAPLWPVDDYATFWLTTSYYRHLLVEGRSPRTALAAARDDVVVRATGDPRLRPRERAELRSAADAFVLVGG